MNAVGSRLRFEVFKRDDFTCRYCGKRSPQVVLELDHIIPKSRSGTDDVMNLLTSCFECNRGKSNVPLSQVITGEDPHDKAIELLERERQLEEYNHVLGAVEKRIDSELEIVARETRVNGHVLSGIKSSLRNHPYKEVIEALNIALRKVGTHSADCVPYFWAILRNWEKEKNGIHERRP